MAHFQAMFIFPVSKMYLIETPSYHIKLEFFFYHTNWIQYAPNPFFFQLFCLFARIHLHRHAAGFCRPFQFLT